MLSDVTLVTIQKDERALTDMAFVDTINQISPAAASRHLLFLETYEEALWHIVPQFVQTSHALIIQYDGFVLDGGLWNPDWLQYDYVGAPWPWHADRRVGNGGFSLRSSKLMKFLFNHREEFPLKTPEDDILCRIYRPALEISGFRWAPESVAREFSFEREKPHKTFGFHGLFNFKHVLSSSRLIQRIAAAGTYARSKPEWRELFA